MNGSEQIVLTEDRPVKSPHPSKNDYDELMLGAQDGFAIRE